MSVYPYIVAGWMMVVGLFGIGRSRNLIHMILCLSVVQSSTYVLLLAVGFRRDATAPVFQGIAPWRRAVDPIVQALTLTDVVVEATVVALMLALAVDAHKRFGTLDPQDLRPQRG
ncbi:MAG TPA: NADH-quinone oxidoreductase subunit K [Baekduia sp.]|nr:NADH-quinone oxidoreductase subunit K [Baekduia sp.]